jgi:Peptidase S46
MVLRIVSSFLCACAFVCIARAGEGMWLLNDFPSGKVEMLYGFKPSQQWLDRVRLSAVRLAQGCSAAFVSARGLVQTNHHCASPCIEQLSTSKRNLLAEGFYAAEANDEIKCPDFELDQLVAISDVSARVHGAISGKEGRAFAEARREVNAAIAEECTGGDSSLRCDVTELYSGGLYHLYKYRRFQDVRLVFAPEQAIAFFGGDPDNFEFPRYDFDVSYLRVYEGGKPLNTEANYFRYAAEDPKPGDLTFTVGNPGATQRLATVAQLEHSRDYSLPQTLFRLSELRGQLTEFSTKGPEQARIAAGMLFGVENSLKGRKGQFQALLARGLIEAKAKAENELRSKLESDPALRAGAGEPFEAIRNMIAAWKPKSERYGYLESGQGFSSELYQYALGLVRLSEEQAKPDAKRLPEYTEANLPAMRQSLLAEEPVYPELERLTLTFSLTKMREMLGPDDDFVKKVLGKNSPSGLANELIGGTKLADPAVRRRLLEGGRKAIEASDDPMIRLARMVDPLGRVIRDEFENTLSGPLENAHTAIARARFAIYGTSVYPDATFTMRISYGTVRGYEKDGKTVQPFTYIRGLYDRATGSAPYKLPVSWIEARPSLNMDLPLNFVTDNDVVGGNSGSPVINKDAEIVGLIFDGNIYSLGGDYGFDAALNRSVAVSVGALREALIKVYRAKRIAEELSH